MKDSKLVAADFAEGDPQYGKEIPDNWERLDLIEGGPRFLGEDEDVHLARTRVVTIDCGDITQSSDDRFLDIDQSIVVSD